MWGEDGVSLDTFMGSAASVIRFFFAPQINPICSPARLSLYFLWAQEMTSHAACGGGEVRKEGGVGSLFP